MSHLFSRLGDLLHFHPLALDEVARKPTIIHDAPAPAGTTGCSSTTDDLSILGLRRVSSPLSDQCHLGQFALLHRDEPDESPDDSIWLSLD
jgi:hypothetical protein